MHTKVIWSSKVYMETILGLNTQVWPVVVGCSIGFSCVLNDLSTINTTYPKHCILNTVPCKFVIPNLKNMCVSKIMLLTLIFNR